MAFTKVQRLVEQVKPGEMISFTKGGNSYTVKTATEMNSVTGKVIHLTFDDRSPVEIQKSKRVWVIMFKLF